MSEIYKLMDGTEVLLDKNQVKAKVIVTAMIELWQAVRKSSKIPLRMNFVKQRKEYFKQSKLEAKAVFMMNCGEQKFKLNRKKEAISKFGNIECLVDSCRQSDSLFHVRSCACSRTKFPPGVSDEEIGKHLLLLHAERVERWNYQH